MIGEGFVKIMEGSTELLVPEVHSIQGPGRIQGRVFFNAQMAFNRDVSVMFFSAIGPLKSALDAMSGTGARAVRVANEARKDVEITANDKDESASALIARNIELNGLGNCIPENADLRCLLTEKVFDYVDLDPFGTPVPFITSAIQGCRRHGILALTATDTASLSGTFPAKSRRRYGSRSMRSPFGHESGLRILIAHVAREAAKLDRGIEPLLCFYADHYFRLHLRFTEGGKAADSSLAHLGYLGYDSETGERSFSGDQPSPRCIGPLWGGPIHDSELLEGMNSSAGLKEEMRCEKYLISWRDEANIRSPYYFENDEIASILRSSPPPMSQVLKTLNENGKASRTHFSPTGFKTDIPPKEVISLISDLQKAHSE